MIQAGLLALAGRRGLANPHTTFLSPAHSLRRSYVLSRFPERRTGFGRTSALERKTAGTHGAPAHDQQTYESQFTSEKPFSMDDSQLWDSSRRMPSSDPEEGLKRLLLNNETLVITRYVFLDRATDGTQLNYYRQLEMLNIFMGFEQSNRYAISR